MKAAEILRLPLRERLQIMEAIWEDLRGRANSFDVSQHQKDLLDARRERVDKGESKILDWETAKHSIGRA